MTPGVSGDCRKRKGLGDGKADTFSSNVVQTCAGRFLWSGAGDSHQKGMDPFPSKGTSRKSGITPFAKCRERGSGCEG